ncbi:hypothetical protein [Caldibacillus debilis]|uniref:Uncharacterized protein n=1 Tax=Caldibacillus debilis GB1 TaxID=1339248 RepID=A0A420VDJ7_9BACI|nr:hypothetical protein [Caldibacillus debilis]RKO61724.1 hypothetical protein Cdeb_01195 [Caldibacillus debilis GB1]
MRKCKSCQGKGFIFDKIIMIKDGKLGFGVYENGIKLPCKKCFGKGMK